MVGARRLCRPLTRAVRTERAARELCPLQFEREFRGRRRHDGRRSGLRRPRSLSSCNPSDSDSPNSLPRCEMYGSTDDDDPYISSVATTTREMGKASSNALGPISPLARPQAHKKSYKTDQRKHPNNGSATSHSWNLSFLIFISASRELGLFLFPNQRDQEWKRRLLSPRNAKRGTEGAPRLLSRSPQAKLQASLAVAHRKSGV